MTAARARRLPRPSAFVTVDVDVDIDPDDLEAQGWVYVGDGVTDSGTLARVIRQAHDDEHEGPIRWCQHVTCRALRDTEGWPTL